MRDDRSKWLPAQEPLAPLNADNVTVRVVNLGNQYVVSGLSIAQDSGRGAGWPDLVADASYELRLRYDQILSVGGENRDTGWDANNQIAVSDMSDGYRVFTVAGARAFACLCQGAELDLALHSRSVIRRLWDYDVLLYRHGTETDFRLHIERHSAEGLYRILASELKCEAAAG